MYFLNSAGGWNRTHEQVEQTPRIDSFELALTHAWGGLFCGWKYLDIYQEEDFCEILPPNGYKINLSHKHNGYGGKQTFFLCPGCGQRVRYLYVIGRQGFRCRKCARLNYRSQQQTKGSMVDYRKGMDYVQKHLVPPPYPIDGFSFCGWIPDRPRGMHQTTYRKHLKRFLRYRQRHEARTLADLMRIIGPAGRAEVYGLME